MKCKLLALMLLLALPCAALGEGNVYLLGGYYHATPLCAEARQGDAEEYARLSEQAVGEGETAEAAEKLRDAAFRMVPAADARAWDIAPCPVCVRDETDYGEPSAVQRGGTAVLRVSDEWIASRKRFDYYGFSGDEVFEGDAAKAELARLLHGDAYTALLDAAMRDGVAEGDVACPSVWRDVGVTEMHARHIGGAWYLAFRPDEEGRKLMKDKGRLALGLRFDGGVIRWQNGTLTHVAWPPSEEEALELKLGAIKGKPVFSGDFEALSVTLFREMETNILVIRESPGDANALGAELTLNGWTATDGLTGYMDGGDAVYVCVLTDLEAKHLREGAFPRLVHPGEEEGETSDGWDWARDDATEDGAESDVPAPGRDLSFLSSYCDAMQVGDWYLACTERTAEGRYDDATRNDSAEWWLLDGAGNVLVKELYWWPKDDAMPLQPRPFEGFIDGVDTAVIRIGRKYGLINRAGEVVVEAKYDDIFGFEPGDKLTPVSLDGRWGAIDEKGNEVVPVVYDSPFSRFSDGVTTAERGGKYCLLGEDGTEILPAEYSSIWLDDGADYGFARKGGMCMLFDRAGNVLFEKKLGKNGWIYVYADATPPFAWSDDADNCGYCGLDGADIPGGPWEDTDPFWGDSATASVQADGRWGEVDREGNLVVRTEYQWVGGYSEGLCPAQNADGLYGCLDEAGNVAIPFEFGDVGGFINGYADAAPADEPDRHGLIDKTGAWVVEPGYSDCVAVGDDGVAVGMGNWKMEFYELTEGGAKRIEGLFTGWNDWMDGLEPNEDGDRLAKLEGAPTLEKRVSDERLPHLDGDRRLYPLYAACVQAIYPKDTVYQAWYSYRDDGNPILTCTGTETAWQRLSDGDADVIFVPAPEGDDPVWATLAARKQEAEFTPLCMDAVVFPVNAANPVADVALDQLKRVYSGKITAWDALGADGLGDIVAYQSREGDDYNDARRVFEKLCAFEDLMPPAEGVIGYEGFMPDVVTGPADYRNLPNAIGYALRSKCLELVDDNAIKLLSVDGVAPTDENIESGAYPYTETLYAVTLKGNDNPNVVALMDWLKSEQGAKLIKSTGFAAIYS